MPNTHSTHVAFGNCYGLLQGCDLVGIEWFTRTKKQATEVAQNALRARTPADSAPLVLLQVFPDKNSQTGKEQHHEADGKYSGDNHIIEKHDGLLCMPVC